MNFLYALDAATGKPIPAICSGQALRDRSVWVPHPSLLKVRVLTRFSPLSALVGRLVSKPRQPTSLSFAKRPAPLLY